MRANLLLVLLATFAFAVYSADVEMQSMADLEEAMRLASEEGDHSEAWQTLNEGVADLANENLNAHDDDAVHMNLMAEDLAAALEVNPALLAIEEQVDADSAAEVDAEVDAHHQVAGEQNIASEFQFVRGTGILGRSADVTAAEHQALADRLNTHVSFLEEALQQATGEAAEQDAEAEVETEADADLDAEVDADVDAELGVEDAEAEATEQKQETTMTAEQREEAEAAHSPVVKYYRARLHRMGVPLTRSLNRFIWRRIRSFPAHTISIYGTQINPHPIAVRIMAERLNGVRRRLRAIRRARAQKIRRLAYRTQKFLNRLARASIAERSLVAQALATRPQDYAHQYKYRDLIRKYKNAAPVADEAADEAARAADAKTESKDDEEDNEDDEDDDEEETSAKELMKNAKADTKGTKDTPAKELLKNAKADTKGTKAKDTPAKELLKNAKADTKGTEAKDTPAKELLKNAKADTKGTKAKVTPAEELKKNAKADAEDDDEDENTPAAELKRNAAEAKTGKKVVAKAHPLKSMEKKAKKASVSKKTVSKKSAHPLKSMEKKAKKAVSKASKSKKATKKAVSKASKKALSSAAKEKACRNAIKFADECEEKKTKSAKCTRAIRLADKCDDEAEDREEAEDEAEDREDDDEDEDGSKTKAKKTSSAKAIEKVAKKAAAKKTDSKKAVSKKVVAKKEVKKVVPKTNKTAVVAKKANATSTFVESGSSESVDAEAEAEVEENDEDAAFEKELDSSLADEEEVADISDIQGMANDALAEDAAPTQSEIRKKMAELTNIPAFRSEGGAAASSDESAAPSVFQHRPTNRMQQLLQLM